MIFNGLLRHLRRRLRMKRRWLTLGTWVLIIGLAGWLLWKDGKRIDQAADTWGAEVTNIAVMQYENEQHTPMFNFEDWSKRIKTNPIAREVHIHKKYVCGEETESLGVLRAADIIKLSEQNPDWIASLLADGTVHFVQHIDDLSPICKQNAYFGLDKNGNLTLFDGKPADEKVIRTFFQLNVSQLESSLPKESFDLLQDGIRVHDIEEYNSVLSSFSTFAVEETEKVIKLQQQTH